nr:uncharacterized protein LOC109148629 isoform X2 [Ipomoea batatas]
MRSGTCMTIFVRSGTENWTCTGLQMQKEVDEQVNHTCITDQHSRLRCKALHQDKFKTTIISGVVKKMIQSCIKCAVVLHWILNLQANIFFLVNAFPTCHMHLHHFPLLSNTELGGLIYSAVGL